MIRPHKIIGVGYLERWHLLPRNRWFNIYLHKFTGSDDERALHDHPWHSVSFLLWGRLAEWIPGAGVRLVPRFLPVFRRATHAHRLELMGFKPAWTLFITGPVIREWGFHCPKGWQHWSTMTTADGKTIGGCE